MVKTGSDFSGVGAFDQALIRLGIDYETVFACDMDKYARQTYCLNFGTPAYYPENVYDRKIPAESLDIYMSSPPCQAFSLAGKRLGENDKRGILFYNTHEFICKNLPRYFIIENVKGLLSDDGGRTFQRWLDLLGGKSINGKTIMFPNADSAPYHIHYQVLNAKHYGIPQNRERVFIVGIRDDADNSFRFPPRIPLLKRLRDVLESEVDEKYYLSETCVNRLVNNNYGHHSTINEDLELANTILASDYKLARGMNIIANTSKGYEIATIEDSINLSVPNSKTRRGRVGKGVAQTLDTACNQGVIIGAIRGRGNDNDQTLELNGTDLSNSITTVQKDNVVVESVDVVQLNPSLESGGKQPYQQNRIYDINGVNPALSAGQESWVGNIVNTQRIRRLTPLECFRLMDFNEDFKWNVSDTQAYKQAGNSICVGVLATIIKNLKLKNH